MLSPRPSPLTWVPRSPFSSHLLGEFRYGISSSALASTGDQLIWLPPRTPGPGFISLTCVWVAGPSPLAVTGNTGAKRPQSCRISFVARGTILAELSLVPNGAYTMLNPGCWGSRDRAGRNQGHVVDVPGACSREQKSEVARSNTTTGSGGWPRPLVPAHCEAEAGESWQTQGRSLV